jgi:alpha-mannosidase
VKPAEDGRGWIWRLVNVTERAVEATFADGQAVECDLMENATGSAGGLLRFGPFEINTLRIGS